jgi:hypothetical protein
LSRVAAQAISIDPVDFGQPQIDNRDRRRELLDQLQAGA